MANGIELSVGVVRVLLSNRRNCLNACGHKVYGALHLTSVSAPPPDRRGSGSFPTITGPSVKNRLKSDGVLSQALVQDTQWQGRSQSIP